MKNTLRKALALLLCLGLCFSLLPLSALAEELEAEEPPVEDRQPVEEPAEEPVEEPEEPAEEPEEPGAFAESEEELLSRQYGEDVIVGFESGEVPESIETEFKLFFGRVEEQLPEALTVYLGGSVYYTEDADGNETVRRIEGAKTDVLAVRWACVEDYNDELEVFHLRPVLEDCELADGVALPEVLLYIEGEFEIPPLTDIPYETEREIPIVGAAHADGARTSFPSAYSSYALGLLPPARNQGDYGTCWAHASIGCVEADLIHDGAVKADEIDLSELHLAYYAYHDYYDEKGCNEGDTIELHGNTGSTYLDFGGSRYVGARVLANQIGPVNESEVPYSLAYNYQPGTAQGRNTSGVQVVDTYWLDPGDTQGIKQAILDHGGIGMSLRYEAAYYNNATAAYYTTLTGTNHAVMLAGWDDDYPVENFRSDRERPSNPGAWLVRNSWGSRWGDHGYFWMSYEDKSFLSSNDVTILDAELLEYDHIYAYDGIPATDGWYYFRGSTSVSFHQYFPVSKGEQIEAIGFETADNALAVEITVTCGSETATVQTGADIPGYYLVKLDKPIEVNTDDWADVAITFTGNQPYYLLEESWDYGDGPNNISFIASCGNPGGGLIVEGEVKNEDGLIKVFTNDIPVVTYTVSYDANGGSGAPAAQTKTHDVPLTLSATKPTRASSSLGSYKVTLDPNGGSVSPTSLTAARSVNYSFDSWNTDKNGSGTPYAPGASYTDNADLTLYAQWTGSESTASVTLPTPRRTGYGFIGWGTGSTATTGITSNYTPSADVTLYALWEPGTYTVSYDANGGSGAPESQTKTHDVPLTLSGTEPTRASSDNGSFTVTLNPNGGSVSPASLTAARTVNYSFNSWNTKKFGGGTPYAPGAVYTANADVTLYAQWTGSESVAAVTLPTPERTGYGFIGWGAGSTATSGITGSYTPSADVTLYALWEPDAYPISYDANGGSGAPEAQTKYHDIPLTLSDTEPTRESVPAGSFTVELNPNGGSVSPTSLTALRSTLYSFDSWNTELSGGGTSYAPGGSYTANVPATLYAQWTERPVTAAIELPTPEREDFFFLGWADDPNAKSGVYGSFIPEGDGTLYAIWSDVPPGDPPESLTLSHEYILLKPDGTAQLSAVDLDPVWPLHWAASADGRVPEAPDDTLAISVSGSGLVSAQHQGTAYAVAYLTDRDGRVAVRSSCRVDVLAGAFKDSVKLTDTKATVELYSTAYTRLGILPVLSQNLSHAQGVEGVSAVNSGFAIERAEFGRYDEAGEVFELRVVDDRTLEIVPKAEFVTTDAAKLKQVKGSYKNSSVTVYVEGEPYFAGLVTLTVKKTQPRVTARAGKLNSFLIEDTQSVTFSVPVASVRVDSTKANPGWLRFDADSSSIRYTGPNDVNQSGRLNLLVKPAGFALELPVAVTVSAGKTAPKLTLKPTTLNLQPGMGDLAVTEAAATLVSFDEWPLTPVSVLEGKNDASDALDVTINGSTVEVREGAGAPRDGKAHSYKLTLALERNGEPSPAQASLTVKLLASSAKPGLTAKASGAVDTAIPRSAVTVALTPKNINAGAVTVTELTVSGARGKAAAEDVTDRFDIEADGLTVTLRQAEGAALEAGTTYTATVRTNVGAEASAKLTVKFSDPNKVKPTVTLKAAGAIDVIRPASSVTVTPTVKNCFTYVPAAGDLQIWQLVKRNGKTACDPADDKFDVCVENGVFVLKLKADSFVDHTADKFAVSFRATLDGTAVETGKTNITVKMGTAKLTQSVKAVNLSAHDRYSRGTVKITKEAGLRDIDWDRTLESYVPPKDRDGNALLDILHLGGGEVAIFYAGSTTKDMKSATVKIPVFLVGNNSLKPNATVSVSVKAVQLF